MNNFNLISMEKVKWELASRLSSYANNSESVLQSVFNEALEEIERYKNITLEKSIKEKISERFSKRKVNDFQDAFICECRDYILQGFSDDDLRKMLREHIKIGSIHDRYKAQLLDNFHSFRKSLKESLEDKANLIVTHALPDIVHALEEEGVRLTG